MKQFVAAMSNKTTVFQVFYTTLFAVLSLVLLVLTLLTPGDLIWQSYANRRLGSIFAVSGTYIFTLLLVILIYASRIFTNRSVLAGIPKAWIPIEAPDVNKSVRGLVVEGLTRSAIIAQQARPRDLSTEDHTSLDPSLTISLNQPPPWGPVLHPGWAAPDCEDLPGLEFEPVVAELPHLIEAKAVSLAPLDPRFSPLNTDQTVAFSGDKDEFDSVPDERVVKILQRPSSMCLRDYVAHLNGLGLINPPQLADSFLSLYEKSRFSTRPLTEAEFRSLMGTFAEILRGMTELDPEIVANAQAMEGTSDSATSYSGKSNNDTDSGSSFMSVNRKGGSLYRFPSFTSSGKASFRLRGEFEQQSLRSVSRSDTTPSTRSLR